MKTKILIAILVALGMFFVGFSNNIFIPSLVNLLLSLLIVSCLPLSSKTFRCILFVVISFLLGVNIHIPDIFLPRGNVTNISVIRPLHSVSNLSPKFLAPGREILKLSPFGNASESLLDTAWPDLNVTHKYTIIDDYLYLETNVIDKDGGHAVINSTYPVELFYVNEAQSSLSLKDQFSLLLNNNFWQWGLRFVTRSTDPVETFFVMVNQPQS